MKMPAARALVVAGVSAASHLATAYPTLPKGFEVIYDVKITIEDGLGPPLQGSYRERVQEAGGRHYRFRDRYTGNLKPAGYTFELGGAPNDTLSSIDVPMPGRFQRYVRSSTSLSYGMLEPTYRLNGKDVVKALPVTSLEKTSFSCEVAGDRYRGETDPETGLLNSLNANLATGGGKVWQASGIRQVAGVAVPGRLVVDESFGNPTTGKNHIEYELVSFRRIERLDRDLTVSGLEVGSRVKDEIEGSVYEIMADGKRREIGEVPKPLNAQKPDASDGRILLFVGILGSAIAVFGLGLSSRRTKSR